MKISVKVVVMIALLAPPAHAGQPGCADPGCEVWSVRYGVSGSNDQIKALAVDPAGERIYVTGWVYISTAFRWATVALDAGTGDRLWAVHAPHIVGGANVPEAITVSPDGSRVYVAGRVGSGQPLGREVFGLRAYDAKTGQELWLATYGGEANGGDSPRAVAVSPDGATVVVAGNSAGTIDFGLSSTSTDYAVVAFDAATGAERWATRYDGAEMADLVTGLALSPDGGRVYVTGYSSAARLMNLWDYLTLALDAEDGRQIWEARHHGPAQGVDEASDIAVSGDGRSVFVTGTAGGPAAPVASTVAYDAETGEERWESRLEHPWIRVSTASALSLDPAGDRIYVTSRIAYHSDARVGLVGSALQAGWSSRFAVIAYDTESGEELWLTAHHLGDGDIPTGLDVYEGVLVATGYTLGSDDTFDRTTLALDATTGQGLWLAGPSDPGESAWAADAAISPDGTLAFVAGQGGATGDRGFLISAYRMGEAPGEPHLRDARGDANGIPDVAGSHETWPASSEAADLLFGRFETTYVAIPVGEDGIRYEPTGLIVRLGTAAPPGSEGPTVDFSVGASIQGCAWSIATSVHGPLTRAEDPPEGEVRWTQEGDGCPDATLIDPAWTVTTRTFGRELAIEIPFSSLSAQQAGLLGIGATLDRSVATTSTHGAAGPGGMPLGAHVVDRTPPGTPFAIGSDVPPDVPCTRGCPDD